MKKFIALVLCLLMAISMFSAVAETEAANEPIEIVVEELFDGVWVEFTDGFELYLPADWYSYECTEEDLANGIFFFAGNEDVSKSCTISWSALETECTIEEAYLSLLESEPEASLLSVNGVGLITYTDEENGVLSCVALDAAEPGLYFFGFSPADDEEFALLASAIVVSIRNVEA